MNDPMKIATPADFEEAMQRRAEQRLTLLSRLEAVTDELSDLTQERPFGEIFAVLMRYVLLDLKEARVAISADFGTPEFAIGIGKLQRAYLALYDTETRLADEGAPTGHLFDAIGEVREIQLALLQGE